MQLCSLIMRSFIRLIYRILNLWFMPLWVTIFFLYLSFNVRILSQPHFNCLFFLFFSFSLFGWLYISKLLISNCNNLSILNFTNKCQDYKNTHLNLVRLYFLKSKVNIITKKSKYFEKITLFFVIYIVIINVILWGLSFALFRIKVERIIIILVLFLRLLLLFWFLVPTFMQFL